MAEAIGLTHNGRTNKQAASNGRPIDSDGAPGMIRTCDPLIRSQVLYPTELRVHGGR